MAISQDSIINDLKLKVKFLEKQKNQLSEGIEEKLLLWLVTETINQSKTKDELLNGVLERISEIRDIPFGICCKITEEETEVLASFPKLKKSGESQCDFGFSPALFEKLKSGPQFIPQALFNKEGIELDRDINLKPSFISLFPFHSLYIPFGVFMFIETDSDKENISGIGMVINQVIKTAVEKLEKLTLLDELKQLNIDFEKKLNERTEKLTDYNKQLKKEIREHRKIEAKLKEEKGVAEKADELKSSFLTNMSHEMRTPLNGILGFSEILRKNDLDSGNKDNYINIIKTCGKSLLKIVDDVIDLSKIESQDIEVVEEDFPVSKLMTELYDHFNNDELFRQREKVELRLNINLNGNTLVRTDKQKIWQIMINLIGNALKFTEEGFVEFGCNMKSVRNGKAGGRDLIFFVKDSGVGVPKGMQESIFDRFVKIEYEISNVFGGTGLGLTIARNLVRLLKGKIWVESEEGKGSRFYFEIPDAVLVVTEKKNLSIPEDKDMFQWKEKLVLVVEDDPMSYIYLKEVLKTTGAKLLHASDGKQAVEMAYHNPDIDLILMDIKLPELDGYEATRQIKQFRKEVPVIAQTAYAMMDDRKKGMEVGCADYITKPINRQKLLQTMDIIMKQS
jgi:signal transduction histidine kinase/ActR/RegA family two-component response regulator